MSNCEHQWEPTGMHFSTSGRKWQQIKEVSYCPQCRAFGFRAMMFLDGDIFKTQADADRANWDERQRFDVEKVTWQREHYSAHVAGDP